MFNFMNSVIAGGRRSPVIKDDYSFTRSRTGLLVSWNGFPKFDILRNLWKPKDEKVGLWSVWALPPSGVVARREPYRLPLPEDKYRQGLEIRGRFGSARIWSFLSVQSKSQNIAKEWNLDSEDLSRFRIGNGDTFNELIEIPFISVDIILSEKRLGAGGYGSVVLQEWAKFGSITKVAVKEFPKDGLLSGYEEIAHEARLSTLAGQLGTSPLCHGVVPVAKEGYYQIGICFQYVQGERLDNFIDMTDPELTTKAQIVSIVKDLAEKLGVLHRANILHNDIKGNNVLLAGDDDQCTIIDFGVASFCKGISYGPNDGHWLSPEVREGETTSRASDVWSLGYIIEEICQAFDLEELEVVYKACCDDDPEERPMAEEVAAFCDRLLERGIG